MVNNNLILLAFLLIIPFVGEAQARKKPNMVIFFVDDMGWADWGVHNPDFYTPHMNRLKNDGMEFTRAYVATPTCSPSRASLLTGKEPVRFLMPRHVNEGKLGKTTDEFNYWPTDPVQMPSRNWLPLEEITYAERLKQLGYYNLFIGKWHLGEEKYYPVHQGFDDQISVCVHGQPGNYYPPYWKFDNPFPEAKDEYLTDILTDKAVHFIRNYDKAQPFQLSFYHFGVHGPHHGKKEFIDRYKEKGWEDKYSAYGAMVTAVDESLGRLRIALEEKGITDNTIILFTSDQGGYFTNFPLRGNKLGGNTLGEGGARVPFVLYWPGYTKSGSECGIPIQTLDVYPTLAEIASGTSCTDQQIQGKSLVPLVKGEKVIPRNLYFFRSYEDQYAAVIDGDWKLIKYHRGDPQLYNITRDKGEVSNLFYQQAGIAEKLMKDLAAWEKEAVPAY